MEQLIENKLIDAEPNTLVQVDSKGRLSSSGVSADDIPSFPTGGNVGDVLTKTADGTEWATPQSGSGEYHNIYIFVNHNSVKASAILCVPTTVVDVNTLCAYLNQLSPPNAPDWYIFLSGNAGDNKTVSAYLYPSGNSTINVYYKMLSIDFTNSTFSFSTFNFSFTNGNGCSITVIPNL